MSIGHRVAARLRRYRWMIFLSLFLVMVSAGLSAATPLLMPHVIDRALPRHDVRLLGWLCTGMITAGVLANLVSVLQGMITDLVGQRVVRDLRVDVYDRVRGMPLEFFSGEANTEIQSRLASDISGIENIISYTAQSTFFSVISLLTSAVVMLILSWPLALISLVLAVLLNMWNNRFARKRRTLARKRQDEVSNMLRMVGEDLSLAGVILGRTLGRHAWQRSRFVNSSTRIADLAYRQRLAGRSARALIGVAFACLPPAVYWLSGTIVPGLTLGSVVVLSTLQTRLSAPIQQLLGTSATVQASAAMFDRIFEYLDLAPTVRLGPAPASAPVARASGLMARDVCHAYPVGERIALNSVRAWFPARSLTVVVGPTGSGKSSLALVLAGLVQPTRGVVEVEGIGPVADDVLRDLVTLVPQETVLLNASLRENLLFARPAASRAELGAALSAACLDELISRLPDGLDTPVGERGYQLSGGERQRVALARALLADSPVLILDESTSALDGDTAQRVHQALTDRRLDKTMIMIAHRIPPLRPHDRVIALDAGRVTVQGTYAELRAQTGHLASPWAEQRRGAGSPETARPPWYFFAPGAATAPRGR